MGLKSFRGQKTQAAEKRYTVNLIDFSWKGNFILSG